MSRPRATAATVVLAGITASFVVSFLVGRAPGSVASLAWGTDEAFAASGLEQRENQVGGGAIRWLGPSATFQFAGLGPGLVDIDLVARAHRTELVLSANGAIIGTLPRGQEHFASRVRLTGSSMVFGIATEGFAAPGRALGTQMVSLRVSPAVTEGTRRGGVPLRLWLALGAVLSVAVLTQAVSGTGAFLALLPPAILLLLVVPAGLWRSPWLVSCAIRLSAATLVSGLVGRRVTGGAWARRWLQVGTLAAIMIHGVLPASPLLNQGDAQLHGNKMGEVASGDLFPTSRTDHRPPFEIPYGFSFYGLLSPWASSGVSNVRLAREGAALFSAFSALALVLVVARVSAPLAAAAIFLWAFAPVNIRTMAFGNLSNVFAQAVFVLFLSGVLVLRPGRIRSGVLVFLVSLSATAHLSSFIVLSTLFLMAVLIPQERHSPAFKPLFVGVALSSAYYACFLPMIMAQAPRLLAEPGGSGGAMDPWRLPEQLLLGLGWPFILLLILSVLVSSVRFVFPLYRSLALTGILLAVVALISPVEVRYLLALMPLLAIVGASPLAASKAAEFPRQILSDVVDLRWLRVLGSEAVARPLALALLFWAIAHGARVLLEFSPLSGV